MAATPCQVPPEVRARLDAKADWAVAQPASWWLEHDLAQLTIYLERTECELGQAGADWQRYVAPPGERSTIDYAALAAPAEGGRHRLRATTRSR